MNQWRSSFRSGFVTLIKCQSPESAWLLDGAETAVSMALPGKRNHSFFASLRMSCQCLTFAEAYQNSHEMTILVATLPTLFSSSKMTKNGLFAEEWNSQCASDKISRYVRDIHQFIGDLHNFLSYQHIFIAHNIFINFDSIAQHS